MSVDVRGSGSLSHGAKLRMRRDVYELTDRSFRAVGVGSAQMHREDRGDGFIAALDARVPPAHLIGPWLAEVHQGLRPLNEERSRPLGLRVALHVGPVEEDDNGLAGEAMDLVCRLADAAVTRAVLERSGRDLVCVASERLYQDVIRHGGRFIEPSAYRSASLTLKEGPALAWFHVPGEPRPVVPGDEGFAPDRTAGAVGTDESQVRGEPEPVDPADPVGPADPADSTGVPGRGVTERRERPAPVGTGADGTPSRAGRKEAVRVPHRGGDPDGEPGAHFDIDVAEGDNFVITDSVVRGGHFGRRVSRGPRDGDGGAR
ncbi:hypothetical protein [Streptomyces sp. DSM 15324]|uniref:hypothetical protein n=1 Tax=Streptomyces sp. DSM 15324 TaxID=1739111 RepID=UPI00131EB583|nr:hypothetical protein [Streptomyces sp. DSM 15324]